MFFIYFTFSVLYFLFVFFFRWSLFSLFLILFFLFYTFSLFFFFHSDTHVEDEAMHATIMGNFRATAASTVPVAASMPCTTSAEEMCHPPWWLLLLCRRFGARSSRVVLILMPKCGLGWIALAHFQPNPKNVKKITTTKFTVYTAFLYMHFFVLGIAHFVVCNKLEMLLTPCFFIHALLLFWA